MIKPFNFHQALFAPAMLLLCGIFLNSCQEEMPILKPLAGSVSGSSASNIVVNINSSPHTLKNETPGYAAFALISTGAGTTGNTQYNVSGSNGSQNNAFDFVLAFAKSSTNNDYIVTTSQLDFNNKTYTTLNAAGKAKLTVDKLDILASTTSGSYGYYLYDSVFSPTDSIYVSGTFNIVK